MDIKITNPHAKWGFDEDFELLEGLTSSDEYLTLKRVPFSEIAEIKFGTIAIVRPRMLSDEELLKKRKREERRRHEIAMMNLLVDRDGNNSMIDQLVRFQKVKKKD